MLIYILVHFILFLGCCSVIEDKLTFGESLLVFMFSPIIFTILIYQLFIFMKKHNTIKLVFYKNTSLIKQIEGKYIDYLAFIEEYNSDYSYKNFNLNNISYKDKGYLIDLYNEIENEYNKMIQSFEASDETNINMDLIEEYKIKIKNKQKMYNKIKNENNQIKYKVGNIC